MAPIFTGFRMGFGRVDEPSGASAEDLTATGGVVYSNVTISGTNYNVHRFISSGAFTIGATSNSVRILVVGGGGAGGSFEPGAYGGGGGGAGGVRYIPTITLPSGTYPITVGPGGTGGNPYNPPINAPNTTPNVGAGIDSVFNSSGSNGVPAIRASGGGAGGGGGAAGGSGGSGGGKSYPGPGSVAPGNAGGNDPRANPIAEGNPSGYLKTSFSAGGYGCGGGGGAGSSPSAWQTGSAGITLPGVGTPGNPWLPPSGNVFGGGGGGSSYKEVEGNGTGGPGGGGPAPGTPGTSYTGGGGGGSGTPSGNGGNGGPGVVYVIIPSTYTST